MSGEENRYIDRGRAHRELVLSRILRLWEAHPDHSFCDLVDRYVISIGTMAGHTTDSDVLDRVGCTCPQNPGVCLDHEAIRCPIHYHGLAPT